MAASGIPRREGRKEKGQKRDLVLAKRWRAGRRGEEKLVGGETKEEQEEAMAWRPVLEVEGRENGGNADTSLLGTSRNTPPLPQ